MISLESKNHNSGVLPNEIVLLTCKYRYYFMLAVIAICCFSTLASAQPDTTRWTPELSMQYDDIAETAISPDGKHVAYVTREAIMDKTTSEFRLHIHIVNSEGSKDIQYTHGEHSNWSPQWSPDGDRIAFLSTRDGKPQVFVIRLKGGEAYKVTDAETGVNSFGWGPEGSRIGYVMTDPKSKAEQQREKERRDVQRVNEEFRYDHLYTTEVKPASNMSRSVQQITTGDFHVTEFDWSPDGATIAFAHAPNPRFISSTKMDLSTVPSDSGTVSPLVKQPGVEANPKYSPDGNQIAFYSMGGEMFWYALLDLYVMPAEGGSPTKLASTPNRHFNLISWMDGGKSLLVSEAARTSNHMYSISADGESSHRITNRPGIHNNFSYSQSTDNLAFTYQNSSTPVEVYLGTQDGVTSKKLTKVNANIPKPEMGRTELISWESSDGQTIEGLMTYPVDYQKEEQVPLVLYVHGGPNNVHNRTFTGRSSYYMTQVFAEQGYAVLRPNPRGSDGYGKNFRSASLENWGPGPFKDLMTGIDRAIHMNVAHPDSLAIMGISYGGYMTAYAVTQTNRFAAASMYAGISNIISNVGTSDIPDSHIAQMGGGNWEDNQIYEDQSPIYHVSNVATPTQVLHGTADKRVPPSQGKEFYRALNRQNVETELILYPRQPHGPQEPKQMMDITPRIIDWFDKHLGRNN